MFTTLGGPDLDLARERGQQIARGVREDRLGRRLRSDRKRTGWEAVFPPTQDVVGLLRRALLRVGARYRPR